MTDLVPYSRLVEKRTELCRREALRSLHRAIVMLHGFAEEAPALRGLAEQLLELYQEIGSLCPPAVQRDQVGRLRERVAVVTAQLGRVLPESDPSASHPALAGDGLARVLDHPGRHLGDAPRAS
jgi:hypothetical protein